MSTSRASAKWRRKKLDENASEFRAKEALRVRNYRSQKKEKQGRSVKKRVEDSRVVQDEYESEEVDDVDAWLYNAVECYPRASHSGRSSPLSSTASTPAPQPPSRSIKNLHKDDETHLDHLTHSESHLRKTITYENARNLLANGQKTLQEWTRRWGTSVSFLHRFAHGLAELPVDHDGTHEEILDMVRKGRQELLQLESIASIDFRSIQVDDFPDLWIDAMRVIGGLSERIAQADVVLELRSEVQAMSTRA